MAFDYLRWYAVQRDYRAHLKPEPRISQVEAHYFVSEIENHVRMLVRKMPRQRYTVFLMSRRDGLNYREIAHKLNISHKTVANHLHLALCEIKHELDEIYAWINVIYSFGRSRIIVVYHWPIWDGIWWKGDYFIVFIKFIFFYKFILDKIDAVN